MKERFDLTRRWMITRQDGSGADVRTTQIVDIFHAEGDEAKKRLLSESNQAHQIRRLWVLDSETTVVTHVEIIPPKEPK